MTVTRELGSVTSLLLLMNRSPEKNQKNAWGCLIRGSTTNNPDLRNRAVSQISGLTSQIDPSLRSKPRARAGARLVPPLQLHSDQPQSLCCAHRVNPYMTAMCFSMVYTMAAAPSITEKHRTSWCQPPSCLETKPLPSMYCSEGCN